MLEKNCECCGIKFILPNLHKKNVKRRFCGPICSRRWASNNRSETWKHKASLAKQGKNNPMYGVNHSPTAKEKIRQAGIGKLGYWFGKNMSDESNQKRSKSLIGKIVRPESIQKMIQTKIAKGIFWKPDDPKYIEFKKYRRKVYYWTRKNDLTQLKNHEKRALLGYHLDHKYSITEGFKNNVPPKVIGSINNLEFIPYNVNTSKGIKCSITLEKLNELFTAVNRPL
jgi:NUMOD3 motif